MECVGVEKALNGAGFAIFWPGILTEREASRTGFSMDSKVIIKRVSTLPVAGQLWRGGHKAIFRPWSLVRGSILPLLSKLGAVSRWLFAIFQAKLNRWAVERE